jgi:hypothetical protein
VPRDRIKLPSPDYKTGIIVIIITGQYVVVDIGFEPIRCSPSDRSPGLIRPSRPPGPSTIEIGGRGRIRTDGVRDLQSLALGHSATRPLVLLTRIELVIQSYQDCGIPLTYRSRRTRAYIAAEARAVLLYAACCAFNTSFKRSAA